MMGVLLRLLAFALAAYGGYGLLLWTQQSALMFPIAGQAAAEAQLPAGAEAVVIPGAVPVHAVFLRARRAGARAPAIVYHHGNAQLAAQLADAFGFVTEAGIHVLVLEYPGYGGAPGTPSLDSLGAAASTAYDWLVAQPEVDPARIVSMGVSIGGGPACELTRLRSVRALVLMSTFQSTAEFAAGYGLPAFLVRDRFENLARVGAFGGPVLVFHGRRDEIIPFADGQALARAAAHGELAALDCGHNDCFYRSADFARRLALFFRSNGVLESAERRATESALAAP